jgi:osmotically-inducible protein OsmY
LEDEVRDAINAALLHDPRVMSFNVDADVLGGTVTLRGEVDNLRAKRAAEQDAEDILGVSTVYNRLKECDWSILRSFR